MHRVSHSHTSHECRATRKFSEDGERIVFPSIVTRNTIDTSRNFHPRRCEEIEARRIFSKSFQNDLRLHLISRRAARRL